MTKANETPSKATEANTSNASKAAPSLTLQKGMRRLRSPHYHLEVGNELLGKVVAKHKDVASKKFKNKVRTGTDKKSKEPIVVTGETGTPCRFQVRAGMGQLFDMVSVGDVVNMVVTGKVGTDKGNDAWTFDVAVGNNSGDDGDEDDLNY
jgi:hypothetical protein